jgi:hypothetical protein
VCGPELLLLQAEPIGEPDPTESARRIAGIRLLSDGAHVRRAVTPKVTLSANLKSGITRTINIGEI